MNALVDEKRADNQAQTGLSRRGVLAAAVGAMSALSGPAGAQAKKSLKVLSAGSTLYGMRPVAALFTQRSGIAVAVATDHGHNIEKFTLANTADADVIVVPNAMVAKVAAAGHITAEPVAIGAVRIGAAVREDAPRPDVATMDALRRSIAAANSVLLTLAPTGDHMMMVIERFGLASAVAPKLKRFDTATLLNKHLAENPGSGALGFGPTTEILTWRGKGVALAGVVPNEIQVVLPYQAAVLKRTQASEEAHALLAFLATPDARKHFLDSGVE